jgi:hypothetical protein
MRQGVTLTDTEQAEWQEEWIETMETYLEYVRVASAPSYHCIPVNPRAEELAFRHLTGVWPSEIAHI